MYKPSANGITYFTILLKEVHPLEEHEVENNIELN